MYGLEACGASVPDNDAIFIRKKVTTVKISINPNLAKNEIYLNFIFETKNSYNPCEISSLNCHP